MQCSGLSEIKAKINLMVQLEPIGRKISDLLVLHFEIEREGMFARLA